MRTVHAIENEIAAHKERFDALFINGTFAGRYSRASLLRQWRNLNVTLKPLVAELKSARRQEHVEEVERLWIEHTRLQTKRGAA